MRLIDADAAIKDARLNYGGVQDAVLMEHFLNSQPTVQCENCARHTNAIETIKAINAELIATRSRNFKICKYKGDRCVCRCCFRSSGTEDCWEWCNLQKNYGKTEIMQSPNDPLTLDELREMDGKPLWYKSLIEEHGEFFILRVINGNHLAQSGGSNKCSVNVATYGKTWLAYRRRPEEGTL